MTNQVVLTGGSGKLGRACLTELLEHGYSVTNVDVVRPPDDPCPFVRADVTDMGQAMEVLHQVDERYQGVDAIVHLAAVPAPGLLPGSELFRNNTMSTYNIFAAARHFGIRNMVFASSESLFGLPFDLPPAYLPLDEEYGPLPQSSYSLSKVLGEQMARHFCRWDPLLKIASLRFSNVMGVEDYAVFPSFEADPARRKWNLWSYIDARDAAQAVRKALGSSFTGAEVFIIANADTVMSTPTAELVREFYPNVPRRGELAGTASLLAIEKARRLLGYEPQHPWRSELSSL
jgi:nucleoside-diphosphate-sugar epimerase